MNAPISRKFSFSISILFIQFILFILLINSCSFFEHIKCIVCKCEKDTLVTPGPTIPPHGPNIPDTLIYMNVKVLNPYQNYQNYYRGELHCHSNLSHDGCYSKINLIIRYMNMGYDFLCITDHYGEDNDLKCSDIFNEETLTYPFASDKKLPFPSILIPGLEHSDQKPHFLEIGLKEGNSTPPFWDGCPEKDSDIEHQIRFVEAIGGFGVAAHPHQDGHKWSDNELYHTEWLRGIDIEQGCNASREKILLIKNNMYKQ